MSTFFEIRAAHEAKNDCFTAYNVDLGQFIASTNERAKRPVDPTKHYGKMLWHSQGRRGQAKNDGQTAKELGALRDRERQERAARLARLFNDGVEERELDLCSLIEPALHVRVSE